MPCQGNPYITYTDKEIKAIKARQEREYKKSEKEKQRRLKMMNDEIDTEISERHLEKLFFNSPMTVFLCKTMDIVVRDTGYKYITHDLEWWYKEHKYRDHNNGESLLDKEELAKKLIQLNKIYKVTK
jgi:hypothetical protein